MLRVILVLLSLSICTLIAVAEEKTKPAALDVLDFSAKRENGLILVDARVRNASARPLNGLTLIFRFQADAETVVTTQRIGIEESSLAPGEDSEISAQMKDTPRAVQVIVGAEIRSNPDLRVSNSGPFAIE